MPKEHEENLPISLCRVEERIERVPLTPEQVQERMHAAATILLEAIDLDRQTADLKESAKSTQKRADSKHEQVDQIVLDAQSGTAAAPYPVIVERHPYHQTEMMVWRVPDGGDAEELLATPVSSNVDEYLSEREAQGCVLVEQRAMTSDELRAADLADHERRNPELPFATPAASDLARRLEEAMGAHGEPLSAREIGLAVQCVPDQVRDALGALVSSGRVEKVGAGRGTRYALVASATLLGEDLDDEDGEDLDEAAFEI